MERIFSAVFLFFTFVFLTTRCSDEEVTPNELLPVLGTDEVSTSEGWRFDKAHSSVRWETDYLGTAALLTGRFNQFSIELEFDEDNPENISLNGNVTLSSVNTGEPGRDGGCLLETLGVDVSDVASFVSTSVNYSDGVYKVTGSFTFHGVTKEITIDLEYLGTDELDGGNRVAGFQAEFGINALTIFGIESGNIADQVLIKINGQFKE